MKDPWKHITAGLAITAVFLACALATVFSGVPVSSPSVEAGVERAEASAGPDNLSPGEDSWESPQPAPAPVIEEAPIAVLAPAPRDPAPQAPVETPQEPAEPPQAPDAPRASAINLGLAPPANFTAQFYYSSNRRAALSWQAVSYPVYGYYVLRWSSSDFNPMLSIFRQLAVLDPSLTGLVDNLEAQFSRLSQSGLTYTERNAILNDTGAAMDPLAAALVRTPGAEDLAEQIVGLADAYFSWSTSYSDTSFTKNTSYLYIAASYVSNGDTSPASNCEGVFTVSVDSSAPARPTGFTATAYDPGVALEWSRNTEADLAGYNVYLGSSNTPLNSTLITSGTEYFHMTGVSGATYRVRAYDLNNKQSDYATATTVAAPATKYDADSPAWVYTGQWAREDYLATQDEGEVLRVARDAGSTASVTFTGRKVRVDSACYWRCGTVNYYIDGVLRGTYDLYYDGGYYPDPPGSPFVPPLWQKKTLEITGLSKGQHTLTIEVSGIAGAGGDTFVDFDYAESK
jgi:hypothetical protein